MRIRKQFAWFGAIGAVGVVACGGTSFNAADVAMDATAEADDGSQPEASPQRHEAGRDAGKPTDAAADHAMKEDAVTADAPAKDVGADDAPSGADGGVDSGQGADAGQDAGHDAGPACASKQASDQKGVYVQAGGPAMGCGTRPKPCPDLPSALAVVDHLGDIYVAGGTYPSTAPIALPDGITIWGGWTVANEIWTGSCDPMDTPTFTGSGQAVFTVGATSPSAGKVTLDTVNVTSTAVATTAQSLYGVTAVGSSGSELVLNDVTIKVPAGGAGLRGAAGATGGMGAAGAPGCPMTAGGGVGSTPASVRGTYGPSGFAPAGTTSNQAGTGQTGATPAPVTTCPPAADGSGTPGDGNPTLCSADANNCSVEGFIAVVTCAPPTNSGCGGGGGTGGFAGGGGGSSIALYLWTENATLESGAFVAASGGAGGEGGAGGSGGPPGAPAPGGATAEYHPGCHIVNEGNAMNPHLACEIENFVTVTAGPGSTGGTGGTGGVGVGGAGGDSYSYYAGGGSVVTVVGAPTFTPAAAAAPGGSPGGASGYIGPTNTAD